MKELIKRAKCLVGLIAIFVIIVTYLCIFEPIERSLFKSEVGSFANLSLAKLHIVDNEVLRCAEYSSSLSAKAALLGEMIKYCEDDLSIEELTDFVQPKYEESIREIQNLVSAARIVDNNKVASYFNSNYCACFANSEEISSSMIPVEFIIEDDSVFLKLVSEIETEENISAYDILIFDFSDLIQDISTEKADVDIIFIEDYLNMANESEVIEIDKDIIVYEDTQNIFAISYQVGNAYVLISTDKENLFIEINKIVLRVIFTWLFILIFIFVVLYLFFFRAAKIKFQTSEKNVDELKDELNRDKLTNAYSRGFLDVWNSKKRMKSKLYTIAMLDIDNFKNVNDKYGHLVGDEVLKDVANEIAGAIRGNDYIIRYGGDEFLILLNETYREDANIIIYRAQEKVKHIYKYDFQVSFSYGLCELYLYDDLSKALETADTNMYINKRNTKEGLN